MVSSDYFNDKVEAGFKQGYITLYKIRSRKESIHLLFFDRLQ